MLCKIETGDKIQFKIDTGAQVNVIPTSVYKQLKKQPHLQKTSQRLFGYTGKPIELAGRIDLKCTYKHKSYRGTFFIANTVNHSQSILGLQASLDLELIRFVLPVNSQSSPLTKSNVLSEYEHLFTGVGTLQGETKIYLRDDTVPVVHPPRRVPHAIRQKLKEELEAMEETRIITTVTEPTYWVNSHVVVEKPNGKLCTCLDPKDLNAAIKRPHYPMPTLEDALSKMTGAKFFSKLDARSGYW